jgi:hypothetical protein
MIRLFYGWYLMVSDFFWGDGVQLHMLYFVAVDALVASG